MENNIFQDDDVNQQKAAAIMAASKPILAELSEAGYKVERISDLNNQRINYKHAIPVLIKWLPIVENPVIKEVIVRALSVPWAKSSNISELLINEFEKAGTNFALKWAIGNALSVVANDNVRSSVVDLIRDESHGKAREMLVLSLGNMRTNDVEEVLIDLLNDENLVGYAIMALGKLKSEKARATIEKLTTHPKSWVRKEAKKTIELIDKNKKEPKQD